MTRLQRIVLDVIHDRHRRGKSLTVIGVANETGIRTRSVVRQFRALREAGLIERIPGGIEHRIVRREKKYPVREDGVTVVPTAYCDGYGWNAPD